MPKNLLNCQLSVNSIAPPGFKSGGRKVRKTSLFPGIFCILICDQPFGHQIYYCEAQNRMWIYMILKIILHVVYL